MINCYQNITFVQKQQEEFFRLLKYKWKQKTFGTHELVNNLQNLEELNYSNAICIQTHNNKSTLIRTILYFLELSKKSIKVCRRCRLVVQSYEPFQTSVFISAIMLSIRTKHVWIRYQSLNEYQVLLIPTSWGSPFTPHWCNWHETPHSTEMEPSIWTNRDNSFISERISG